MMTSVSDIARKRGDTRRHTIKGTDDNGSHDLTGWSNFVMSIHTEKDPVDNSTEVEAINGSFITDGSDGRVGFTPSGTLPVGKYYFDVQCFDSNNEKYTVLEGKYTVSQDRGKS